MIFRMGRKDAPEHTIPLNPLVDPYELPKSTMKDKMLRLGLTTQDFVALMGCHTLGFAHEDRSGFKGRWTMNPHVFDNTYFQEVLLGSKTKYLHTPLEQMLGEDAELRKYVEMYAQDQEVFFEHYAQAQVKMSECGQEENLMCEISGGRKDGYVEPQYTEEELVKILEKITSKEQIKEPSVDKHH